MTKEQIQATIDSLEDLLQVFHPVEDVEYQEAVKDLEHYRELLASL